MNRHLTRRRFLRAGTGVAAMLAAGRWAPAAEADRRRKPNILMILVDDLGYGDLSCYGAKDMQTPHVDALAASGMRFGRFYANCPVCSPTRAALMTGRYPAMVGVPGVIRTGDGNSWGYLDPDAVTLPQRLKQAGYHTAMVGKWHLGLQPPNVPNERGFDFFHGFLGDMMNDYYTHLRGGRNFMRRDRQTIDPEGHATDLFSQWAVDVLRDRKDADEPFFLYLAYNAPHTPIQPPKDWVEKVRKRRPDMPARRAKLVALIEHMDHGIGKVLAALKETGLADNTLVIFTSDNGGQTNVGADNGPLKAGKGTMYEGGLRVPACAAWPGRIAAGSRSARIAATMDLCPTLLAVGGARAIPGIEGQSILPTLLGESDADGEDRTLFFTRLEGGRQKGRTIEAALRWPWKVLRNRPGADVEMYNLDADPLEQTDLAGRKNLPKPLTDLAAALETYRRRAAEVPWRRPSQRG